ncbi:MAG: hypothetical protein IT233_02345 [Bacteroidia bacterium]|nr:hypothetical protein [Bacteroidia bacterium]
MKKAIPLIILLSVIGPPLTLFSQDTLRSKLSVSLLYGISGLQLNIDQDSETYGDGKRFAPTTNDFSTYDFSKGGSISFQLPIFSKMLFGISSSLIFSNCVVIGRVLKPLGSAYEYNINGIAITPGDSVIPIDKYSFRTISFYAMLSIPMNKSKRLSISGGAGLGKSTIYRKERSIGKYSDIEKGTSISERNFSFVGSLSHELKHIGNYSIIGKLDIYYYPFLVGGFIDFYNTRFRAFFRQFYLVTPSIGVSF